MRKCVVRADESVDNVDLDHTQQVGQHADTSTHHRSIHPSSPLPHHDHPHTKQVMDPFAILQRARGFTSVIRTTRPGLTSEELETVALCTVVAASELKAVRA